MRYVTLLIAACIILMSAAAFAESNQTRYWDARGSSIGTATRDSQGTTVFRNSRGSTTGTATREPGGGTVFRDSSGRVTGRSGK